MFNKINKDLEKGQIYEKKTQTESKESNCCSQRKNLQESSNLNLILRTDDRQTAYQNADKFLTPSPRKGGERILSESSISERLTENYTWLGTCINYRRP